MMQKFGYRSRMAVPRIEKATVNTGFGKKAVALSGEEQRKLQGAVMEDLAAICGQKPVLTLAKKSIASFKLRKGQVVGAKVTLRRKKLEDFVDRLVNAALPRSRDFKGIDPKCLDEKGNLTLGIKEQIVFPEITPEAVKSIFGLEITLTTTARNREEGLELFQLLGFPVKK